MKYLKLLILAILITSTFFGCKSEVDVSIKSSNAPSLIFVSPQLNFSSVSSFGESKLETITISNQGKKTVTSLELISDLSNIIDSDSGTCGVELEAGKSCTYILSWEVVDTGQTSLNLTLNFISSGESYNISQEFNLSSTHRSGTLQAKYPGASNFFDHLKDDEVNPCDGTETQISECIHTGIQKEIDIPELSSCDGITAEDDLDVFEWSCSVDGNVKITNLNFQQNKGLHYLVNSSSWKTNFVSVSLNNTKIVETSSSIWWPGTTVQATAFDTANPTILNSSNTVYTLSTSGLGDSRGFIIQASKVALVGVGTSKVLMTWNGAGPSCWPTNGSLNTGAGNCLVSVDSSGGALDHVWIENLEIDGNNIANTTGIPASGARLSYLRNLSLMNFTNEGIRVTTFDPTGYYKLTQAENIEITNTGATAFDIDCDDCDYNTFKNIEIINTPGEIALAIDQGNENFIDGFIASNNLRGLTLANSINHVVRNVNISTTTSSGMNLIDIGGCRFQNFKLSNSGGIRIDGDSTPVNMFYNGIISNSTSSGLINSLNAGTTVELMMVKVLFAANGSQTFHEGFDISDLGTGGLTFSHSAFIGNSGDGLTINNGTSIHFTMNSSLFANNGVDGLDSHSSVNQYQFSNLASLHNQAAGINLDSSTNGNARFQFIMGGNGSNCLNVGATNPGLVEGTCTDLGADNSNGYTNPATGTHNSDAYLRVGRDITGSFVGKVSFDLTNTTVGVNTNSSLAYGSITDWANFDNFHYFFQIDGPSNPLQTDHRGVCDGSPSPRDICAIWDYRLLNESNSLDSILFNRSGNFSATDQENEDFVGDEQTDCPSAVHGNFTLTDYFSTPNTFLVNAIEIVGDTGINAGDDDGLCESNEACIYAPNIGFYQGEGDYLSNGTCKFIDGNVSGVKMYAYPNNGL